MKQPDEFVAAPDCREARRGKTGAERPPLVHFTVVDHSHVVAPLITTEHVEALKDVLNANLGTAWTASTAGERR